MTRNDGEGAWPEGHERKSAISAIRSCAFELGIPIGLVADFWERLSDVSITVRDQSGIRDRLSEG